MERSSRSASALILLMLVLITTGGCAYLMLIVIIFARQSGVSLVGIAIASFAVATVLNLVR
ncbi:hypothetical protein F383_22508 [Gossypium arboreum]|uniref:Uncharacterized protein n=1 Tax=Gossypium arboreum TaxID=29729 RepID=A0A0B0NV83_GOSAR|nr:hypothetical protein F383_22508 [Gossypium arboreum]